jgi:hypothetical protein
MLGNIPEEQRPKYTAREARNIEYFREFIKLQNVFT